MPSTISLIVGDFFFQILRVPKKWIHSNEHNVCFAKLCVPISQFNWQWKAQIRKLSFRRIHIRMILRGLKHGHSF